MHMSLAASPAPSSANIISRLGGIILGVFAACFCTMAAPATAQSISLHTESRPMPNSVEVPVRSSFFLQVYASHADNPVLSESLSVQLQPAGGEATALLEVGGKFHPNVKGSFGKGGVQMRGPAVALNIDPSFAMQPATTYTLTVTGKLKSGTELTAEEGSIQFATEAPDTTRTLAFDLDLSSAPVRWHGLFFSGIMQPSFMLGYNQLKETFEMMAKAQKIAPKAWLIQRDWFIGGFDFQPGYGFGGPRPANIVREKETRHIRSIEKEDDGARLFLEDFVGHEYYGIPSSQTLSGDYKAGYEVLIADGLISTRTLVREVRDSDWSVLVDNPAVADMSWKLPYSSIPEERGPDAPGRLPIGGGYLRRFDPVGTPCYYWGRFDLFADAMVNQYGRRRFVINPIEAPGDLAAYGKFDSPPKDYVQYHTVMREMTSHLIERYGDKCMDFVWSVFNEIDLAHGPMGWQNWTEVQRFYDYTVDAILRSFEDHGYDSEKVYIGGLELGGIFGLNLRNYDFLAHCSPNFTTTTARPELLPYNAAFTDKRLDGKRSKRVEKLCEAHNGKGSPCDFVSVHTYNYSDVAAQKIIQMKQVALDIDPEYYSDLYSNTFESCLTWSASPDKAVPLSYMNNGYFSTWCADVTARLLRKASEDPRYGYGDSVVTTWYAPTMNFGGMNGISRAIDTDDDGDGVKDRAVTMPEQVFHFLTLLNTMGDNYWILPEQMVGQHAVSGFASRTDKDLRLVLYSHSTRDTETRSEKAFDVDLELKGMDWDAVEIEEYQMDKQHNSNYQQMLDLQEKQDAEKINPLSKAELAELTSGLKLGDRQKKLDALDKIKKAGRLASAASGDILALADQAEQDTELREKGYATLVAVLGHNKGYPIAEVQKLNDLAQLRATRTSTVALDGIGDALRLTIPLIGNGANFVILRPAK